MSTEVNDIRFLNRASLRQFYQNSRNNIEDPIFTGFTMEIDKLHSPLFFALAGDEYIATETLRSPEGTYIDLAEKIEEKLAYVNKYAITGNPDSYEINTLQAKDKFGSTNDRRPGYGLWDKYPIDNVLYGAADYIYMVDKVSDGTYTDDYGVVDLGNGTPTSSVYERYNQILESDPALNVQADRVEGKINELTSNQDTDVFFELDKWDILPEEEMKLNNFITFLKENPNCKIQINGYASKDNATAEHNMMLSDNRARVTKEYLMANGIDETRILTDFFGDTVQPFTGVKNRASTCRVIGDYTQESALNRKINDTSNFSEEDTTKHNNNISALESAKELYDSLTNKDSEYQKAQDKLNELKKKIDTEKNNIKLELNQYQNEMSNLESKMKSTFDDDVKDQYKKKIDEFYNKFESFIQKNKSYINNPSGEDYSNVYKNIDTSFLVVSKDDDTKFKSEINELSETEKNDIEYYKKIWAVTKTRLNSIGMSDDAKTHIRDLQNKIEEESKKIFGVHPDGRIGSESDPAGGPALDYLQAKDDLINDNYTQQQQRLYELQDVKNNFDDLQEYNAYQSNKGTIEKALPSIDYTMSPQEEANPTLYNERINKAKNTRAIYEVPQTVYDMMGFIRGMDELIHKYPYAMQTITGLDEAYKKYFDLKDPYMGSGDGKITINCLDYLDMRVSSMFNKYFNAVYDRQYRRERVPINLRRFQCSIFVHDIRNFKDTVYNENVKNSGDLSLITEIALNYFSAVEFKFYDCEIVPEETGGIFDNVTNLPNNDMRSTNFTFTYGNCVINFLPFEDLRRYVLGKKEIKDIKPEITTDEYMSDNFTEDYIKINETSIINNRLAINNVNNDYNGRYSSQNPSGADMAGNFRRWFDKSELGNVNNNDYRDYIRHDSAVAVDDYYKTTIVNDFALGSVGQKNKQLTEMDDALRRIVLGISASTGIPVKGVTDALNIQFIDPIINEKDLTVPIIKNLGNVTNSKIVDEKTTEYVGTVIGDENKELETVRDLGNVENK